MSNAVFPVLRSLQWGIVRNPMWVTQTRVSSSGFETRVSRQLYPKIRFKVSHSALSSKTISDDLYTLVGFFNNRRGSFDSFLFTDPVDKSVTLQSLGAGNGVAVKFQLVRAFGGNTESVKSVNGTALIYVNAVLQTVVTNYNIDALGMVTFVTAPPNLATVTWSGSYYYRCKFTRDEGEFENFMNTLWASKNVEFIGCLDNRI